MGRVKDEIEQTMDNLEAQLGSLTYGRNFETYGRNFDNNGEFNPYDNNQNEDPRRKERRQHNRCVYYAMWHLNKCGY